MSKPSSTETPQPPRLATRLLHWFCPPHRAEELEGDLDELFRQRIATFGLRQARWRYIRDVVSLARPSLMKRPEKQYPTPTNTDMLRNYLKIAGRNLVRNKVYSFINIGGLAIGMTVAMLIGLWLWDELSYNKSFANYDRIAQVMQHQTINGSTSTSTSIPIPLANELRTKYSTGNGLFQYVVLSSWTEGHVISFGDKKLWKAGNYIEPQAPDMFSLEMISGSRAGLREPYSILLSESVANALFGARDPTGQLVKIDNKTAVKVTGVFKDFPYNTQFNIIDYMVPWQLNVATKDWVRNSGEKWDNNSFQLFVQLTDQASLTQASARIKYVKRVNVRPELVRFNPEIFLQPMSRWHLYSEFKEGLNVGGQIQFVWLFGSIAAFVLLLACINFMNLSTARSEKRAKEVGIRKAVGSVRTQLISQFLSESLLVAFIAFVLAILMVQLMLPFFNEVAAKKINMPWSEIRFWTFGVGFTLITGLLAGSYPALYLSGFQPVKVLKGTFRVGRFASLPRKALVVVQFTVSVTLIIGTILVFRQIQFAQDRPVGYNRQGLVYIQTTTPDIHNHYDAFRKELFESGAAVELAESESPLTSVWNNNGGFDWDGKDPNQQPDFAVVGVTHAFGKTVGWHFKEGRDFSKDFSTDSSAMVLNEAAIKFMGIKNPLGKVIREGDLRYTIIGIINDMVMESPYDPTRQTLFYLLNFPGSFVNIRLNPAISTREAIDKIEPIFQKYNPTALFDYKFADEEYTKKFAAEKRIGTLASSFALLAIFISCLGLFGLASFTAEQRTKEIGVRKVLGASILNVWALLSKDFVILVLIGFSIATPLAYYVLSEWLQNYQYRTEISWWIFAVAGLGALMVTLLTVSFQSIKAALVNPVTSLRSE